MLEPKRVEMNVQPNSIEKLGNGTYYYNYDITSKEVDVTDPETEEVTQDTSSSTWSTRPQRMH